MPILPISKNIDYLVGDPARFQKTVFVPFDQPVCEFLNRLSVELRNNEEVKRYPDVAAFGFWCRRANITTLKARLSQECLRLGRGIIFHIAPSNVPVNFAFSLAFSLLAGNSNVVRVSSRESAQVDLIAGAISRTAADPAFHAIAKSNAVVRYAQDDELTGEFSRFCNGRVIWGGNQTIKYIRQIPVSERAVEIAFADRYSFCTINAESVLICDNESLQRLAAAFYNDTYVMDQNACSSPHLVVWLGREEIIAKVKPRFWANVHSIVSTRYTLTPIAAVNKYTQVCKNSIDMDGIKAVRRFGNCLYVVELAQLPDRLGDYRGSCGYFYEYDTRDLNEIARGVDESFQTLTYYGLERSALAAFVLDNRLSGIDRIVPVGRALDISVIWDGYDVVGTLSRICDIQGCC